MTYDEQFNPLPTIGKLRWSKIKPFSHISRTKFWELSKEGKAPKPERMGASCTFYDAKEVHRWLSDPLNYRAEG